MAIAKFHRGGIYLARLDPVKGAEAGKLRPIIILMAQILLDVKPPQVFVIPLSSQSQQEFQALHVALESRDNLNVKSFALIEHSRSISIRRIQSEKLAQLHEHEIKLVTHRLKRLIDL